MRCCATTASSWASAIIWGASNGGRRIGRTRSRLGKLLHQLFDAGEEFLFAARVVGETQLERTLEPVLLGLPLDHLQDPLRIRPVLLLEQQVAAAGTGVYFSN